jgi:MOSC domain-containing protein YiiM
MSDPILVSVQVGLPKALDGWTSAIFKAAVHSPVWLSRTNLEGDRQADLRYHGGPDKAVLAYSADHYAAWRNKPGLEKIEYGAFGENFSIAGQTEETVCLDDVYFIGEVIVQVSRPRTPCGKLARKWNLPHLTTRVAQTGRSGWYLRVLKEGFVTAGTPVCLDERPHPESTIAHLLAVKLRAVT